MRKFSLNTKFMIVVSGLSLACLCIAWLGLSGMSAVSKDLEDIVSVDNLAQDKWFKLENSVLTFAVTEREYYREKESEARKKSAAMLDTEKKNVNDLLAELENLIDGEDQAKFAECKKQINDWWSIDQDLRTHVEKSEADAAFATLNKSREAREAITKLAQVLLDSSEKAMNENVSDARAHYIETRNFVFATALFAVVVGFIFAFLVMWQIRKSIHAVVRGLADSSDQVEAASQQVAQSSSKLSQSTTEQAASLQETAASAQELTSMVQRNMQNARASADGTRVTQESAQKGKRVVDDMTRAIAEINLSNQNIMNEVNKSNTQIAEITKVISEIGNKTKVINDIVFQTKLLSFNASVEAARAGEHGRGFAVVAEEVGNLARMSGEAAKDISQMLENSIEKVETIVRDTKVNVEKLVLAGKKKVEDGTRIAEECTGVLDEIVHNVSDITRMSTDISAASEEQASGVQEISRSVSQLDYVTQTNASAAEQAASAAVQLSSQAKTLKSTVESLLEIVNGTAVAGSSGMYVTPPMATAKPAVKMVEARPKAEASKKPTGGNSGSGGGAGGGSAKPSAPITTVKGKAPAAPAAKPQLPPKVAATKAAAAKQTPAPEKASNVTQIGVKKATGKVAAPAGTASGPLKLAAGADTEIPAENDPRFKDV